MIQQTQQSHKMSSFVKKPQKDSTISDISESEPSERRILAHIENQVW